MQCVFAARIIAASRRFARFGDTLWRGGDTLGLRPKPRKGHCPLTLLRCGGGERSGEACNAFSPLTSSPLRGGSLALVIRFGVRGYVEAPPQTPQGTSSLDPSPLRREMLPYTNTQPWSSPSAGFYDSLPSSLPRRCKRNASSPLPDCQPAVHPVGIPIAEHPAAMQHHRIRLARIRIHGKFVPIARYGERGRHLPL